MQTNFSDKNKSRLIKITETKKNKARHRLIGSIFLLVVALVILLKVTSRVTPIDNPVAVEIKNTSPVASKPVTAPAPTTQAVATTTIGSKNIVASAHTKKVSSTPFKIVIPVNPTQSLKPRIITDTHKSSLSPEDILNGQSNQSIKPHYFVQLITSSDKNKLIQMQDNFASKGIKTVIQSADTPNGTVYRLRSGPFSNETDAQSMLKYITIAVSEE